MLTAACLAAIGICLVPAVAPAKSPFAWRAIVEGPYGRPWDAGQRARALRWMARHDMNAYVHAPKEDLYQRTLWREHYPAQEMSDFEREIAYAKRKRVQWIPNLSPALPLIPTPAIPSHPPSAPLCFSCTEDLNAVLSKFEPFRRLGVRTFMVSFDDVVKALSDPRDLGAYGGAGDEAFGRASGDFLTRLLAALRQRTPRAGLVTVGADYSGTADTDYLRGLRSTLDPAVGVMWTGTSVPARDFSAADARAYGEAIGRKPLLWDNWTNNDTAGNAIQPLGTARIFLGPYRHKAEIAAEIDGIFLNPANEADLNLLPFGTAVDFMRSPRRYRPRRSWLRSVTELAGGRRARRACRRQGVRSSGRRILAVRPDRALVVPRGRCALRESLRAFAETSYSTKLGLTEAPTFMRLSAALLDRYGAGGRWPRPFAALEREQRLVMGARERLGRLRNRAIFVQARPFLDAAREAAGTGLVAARLLAAERPALEVRSAERRFVGRAAAPDPAAADALRSEYQSGRLAFQTARRFVYGWRGGVGFDIPPYEAAPNALEAFFDRVDGFDSEFQGRAEQAAGSVRVALGGREVRLAADGSFRLPRAACGRTVVATDGAGGRTARRLKRCRAPA